MKKILFISQYLNRNGTEAFMMNVFRSVDHDCFSIDFLIFDDNDTDYSKEVEQCGSTIFRLPNRKTAKIGYYANLCRFFQTHASEYSAVHFCGVSLSSSFPIVSAWLYGIEKIIVHAHNSSARGLHNRLLHLAKRDFVRRISTHHFACSSLAAEWFFADHPSVIIQNGIDIRNFQYNESLRQQRRDELGITEGTRIIGHVGRFVPEKNHDFILDIFASYCKSKPDSVLVLVGIGPLMDDAKTKVRKLGIADKVMFLGERRDVNELMQVMDLFLMPSLFEGQPLVLIEAQCTGLPCLISDTINKDITITDTVTFKSLHDSADEWAKTASEMKVSTHRAEGAEKVKAAGYHIKDTVKYLESVYGQKQ